MAVGRYSRGRPEGGAVAVEFALVVLPFVTLLLGTIQFAWYFYGAQSASAAAREGARQVVVGKCWKTAAAPAVFENYVKAQSSMVTSASYLPMDLSAAHIGDTVTVTVQADAGSIHFLPLPGGGHVTRVFQARLEDQSPGDGTC